MELPNEIWAIIEDFVEASYKADHGDKYKSVVADLTKPNELPGSEGENFGYPAYDYCFACGSYRPLRRRIEYRYARNGPGSQGRNLCSLPCIARFCSKTSQLPGDYVFKYK
jgi:hypothetical protein